MPVYGIYRMILEVVGHDQSGSLFKRITAGLSSIFQYATAIVGAMVFERIASGIGQLVSQSVEAVAWMQQLNLGLASLVAREMVQTGVAENVALAWDNATIKAKGLSEQLQNIAILSPYTVESVAQTYKMAMAFGFTTDQAMTFTNALLENAAGIGASNDMLDRMAYNLAQVRLQGKVTALDVRQLALAGFDLNSVLKYIGKQMGIDIKTHLDFNDALKAGKITWEDFTKYFAQYADENFGGASERMARSLMGLKSTFHDIFVLTMPRILGPAAETITGYLNKLLDWFIKFRASGELEKVGEKINAFVKRVIWTLQTLFSTDWSTKFKIANIIDMLFPEADAVGIADKIIKIWDGVTKVWNKAVEIFTNVADNIKTIFGGLKQFWDENGAAIVDAVGGIFKDIDKEATGTKPTWIDMIFKPLQEVVKWLVANGPKITKVIGTVASFIGSKVLPVVTQIITFISNNWQGILTFFLVFKFGIGIVYGLLTAFMRAKEIIAFVQIAMTSITGPIMIVIGVIALLAAAWANNWFGIREKMAVVWAWLQPILATIAEWLQVNIPIAVQWLSDKWNTVLLPAIQDVWSWIQTNLVPFFEKTLVPLLKEKIGQALQDVAVWWGDVKTKASDVWTFFTTYIVPIFNDVVEILGKFGGIIGTAAAGFWDKVLQPAAEKARKEFEEHVLPILRNIADFIEKTLGPKVQWLDTDVFSPLGATLKDLAEKALTWIHTKLQDLKDLLDKFKLPWWLTPSSPTPFEIGLMGINEQLDKLSKARMPKFGDALGKLPANLPRGVIGAAGTGINGGVSVTVNIPSIASNVDVDRMAYKIAQTIQRKRSYG